MNSAVNLLGLSLNSQSRRRTIVVALYASYLLVLAPFWLAHNVAKPLLALAVPAFLLLTACLWAVLRLVRNYAYPSATCIPALVDERQAQIRDHSYVTAYQILSVVVCLYVIFTMFAHDFGIPAPSAGQIQALLFGALLITLTLPASVVAWSQPDDAFDLATESSID